MIRRTHRAASSVVQPWGALPPTPRRRVVVTGVGSVSPLGRTTAAMWAELLRTRANGGCRTKAVPLAVFAADPSGGFFAPSAGPTVVSSKKGTAGSSAESSDVAQWQQSVVDAMPCKVVAAVPSAQLLAVDPTAKKPAIDPFAPTTRETRYTRFALTATHEALADAGWLRLHNATQPASGDSSPLAIDSEKCAVVLGVGMPSLNDVADVALNMYRPSVASASAPPQLNKVSPFFVPKILANMVTGAVAIKYGLRSANLSSTTACATGAHCIGDAARLIASGECDFAVAGAAEACICPISIAGFSRMKALSTDYNATPEASSRPFDEQRDGFIMGEGSGVVALETLESALARGAKIYGEVRGYAATGDAHHITSPRPNGGSVIACVNQALARGGVDPTWVQYVNAHATSTPMGDEIELAALAGLFSRRDAATPPVLVSSTKGHMGHLLGAAGSVEAIVALLALRDRVAPPTANLERPIAHDPTKVCLVRDAPAAFAPSAPSAPTVATVSTSFGFGGTNAALVFTRV